MVRDRIMQKMMMWKGTVPEGTQIWNEKEKQHWMMAKVKKKNKIRAGKKKTQETGQSNAVRAA
jgi:hypothetical protein